MPLLAETDSAPAGRPRRPDFFRVLATFGPAFAVFAALVRVLAGDRIPGLSALVYATPPIVLAAIAGAAGAIWWRRRRPASASLCLLLAVAMAGWWHVETHFGGGSLVRFGSLLPSAFASPRSVTPVHSAAGVVGDAGSPPPATVAAAVGPRQRIAFWNVGRGALGWSRVIQQLDGLEADLIGLGECRFRDPLDLQELSLQFAQRELWFDDESQLLLIAPEPISLRQTVRLASHGAFHVLDTELTGAPLTVVLADLSSDPFRPRDVALRILADTLATLGDRAVVVMGDFNTPLDSVHWQPLRSRLTHAFEAAGNGYAVTWPQPLPVMMLDHVWVSPEFQVASCRLPWTWVSDHRPVVVDCRVAGSRPAIETPFRPF